MIRLQDVRPAAVALMLALGMAVAPTAASADEIGAEAELVVSVEGGFSFLGGRLFGPPQMSDDARYVVYREGVDSSTLHWLDRESGEDRVVVAGIDSVGIPEISGDGQWVVFIDFDARAIRLWSAATGALETLETITDDGASFGDGSPSISFSGERVVWNGWRNFGRSDHTVRLWDRSTGSFGSFPGSGGSLFSDGSRFAYVPAGQSQAVVRDVATGLSTDLPSLGVFSSDGGIVATGVFQPRALAFTDLSSGEAVSIPIVDDTQLNTPIPLVSGDGAFGFFNTNVALVPEDVNGLFNAYRVDLATGELAVISVPTSGTLIDVSADGRIGLFFEQAETFGYKLTMVNLADPLPSVSVGDQQLPQLTDQVRRLYQAFFLRPPDAEGLSFWSDVRADGQSLASVAERFAQSPEFVDRYGDLTDAAFVDLIYVNVQGRAGEEAGRTFWIGQLASGVSRGQVMVGFSESPEFISTTSTSTPTDPRAASVWRLYRAYYLRGADQGGFDFWYQQLVVGGGLASISTAFSEAPEFDELYGELTDDEFVVQVYRNVLDRSPDTEGLDFWRGQMSSGLTRGELMLQFSESAEFVVSTDSLPSI